MIDFNLLWSTFRKVVFTSCAIVLSNGGFRLFGVFSCWKTRKPKKKAAAKRVLGIGVQTHQNVTDNLQIFELEVMPKPLLVVFLGFGVCKLKGPICGKSACCKITN